MDGLLTVALAVTSFVGTRFLLSHPSRPALGEPAFMGVYSLVAVATIAWLAHAYRAAPRAARLWPVGDATRSGRSQPS